MKRMKKIVSLVLAVIMALAMTTTAFAADNNPYKITVKQNAADQSEHSYEAYQVFAGDIALVGENKVLSNIIWGSGVNGNEVLDALKSESAFIVGEGENAKNVFADCTTAAQVAEVLGNQDIFKSSSINVSTLTDTFARIVEDHLTTTVAGSETGTGNVEIEVIGAGYYLIKDQDGSVENDSAYSRFMLEVVGDAQATVKSDVPTGTKQIFLNGQDAFKADGVYDPSGNKGLAESNNAGVGDHVLFQIDSKVPNYTGYDYYYFYMTDTMDQGLTFDGPSSVKVTVDGKEVKPVESITTAEDGTVSVTPEDAAYNVYVGADAAGATFKLAFLNIKDYEIGKDIVVTYSATINEKAVIGNIGNKNTWSLSYSKNPNEDYGGTVDQTKPGLPLDENDVTLGETPDDITITYLTELDITKYGTDSSTAGKHLLAGAEFRLEGTSKQVVANQVDYFRKATAEEIKDEAITKYWKLLGEDENNTYADGLYTSTPPTGTEYVEIGVGTEDTTTGYILKDGKYVVPADTAEYVGETLYKLVKGTAEDYADVNTQYVKDSKTEITLVDTNVSIEKITGEDGFITFRGLGAGTYTLTETVTPDGYNTLEPITIVIDFKAPDSVITGEETCIWTMTGTNADGSSLTITNNNMGIFGAEILNQSGSLLPSTGGIGTTIFYVVGAVLVIGAGILLVAKKRMSDR